MGFGIGIGLAKRRPGSRFPILAGNLLLVPDQFDNATWSKQDVTVTANAATGPDATSSADLVLPNAINAPHFVFQTGLSFTSGVAYTLSVYAKASGYDYIRMTMNATTFPANNRSASFNLATGAIGATQSGVTPAISALGGGWYRCAITVSATATGTNQIAINVHNADSAAPLSFAGNTTSGVLMWRAQLTAGA